MRIAYVFESFVILTRTETRRKFDFVSGANVFHHEYDIKIWSHARTPLYSIDHILLQGGGGRRCVKVQRYWKCGNEGPSRMPGINIVLWLETQRNRKKKMKTQIWERKKRDTKQRSCTGRPLHASISYIGRHVPPSLRMNMILNLNHVIVAIGVEFLWICSFWMPFLER